MRLLVCIVLAGIFLLIGFNLLNRDSGFSKERNCSLKVTGKYGRDSKVKFYSSKYDSTLEFHVTTGCYQGITRGESCNFVFTPREFDNYVIRGSGIVPQKETTKDIFGIVAISLGVISIFSGFKYD